MKTIALFLLLSASARADEILFAENLFNVMEWSPSRDGSTWWRALMKNDAEGWRMKEKFIRRDGADTGAKDLAPLVADACAEVARLFELESAEAGSKWETITIPAHDIDRIKDAVARAKGRAKFVLESMRK